MDEYAKFIESKAILDKPVGFDVPIEKLNPKLKDWQAISVQWGLRRGRGGLFEGCGLGKTFQQLVWGEHVVKRENGTVLLLCPIGVRLQTIAEAVKFGIDCDVRKLDSMADLNGPGIYVSNYEKLHKIDAKAFVGVIPDESGILKSFSGATKRQLIEMFARTQYKLPCTATPSPNDHMELGNHSEFLGAMPSSEMLSRWFLNDTMKSGGYVLLNHAKADFWRWVCSWAICLSKPSDLGDFSDEGYILPGIEYEFVTVDIADRPPPGMLFSADPINATTMHREKRISAEARAAKVAEIVATDPNDFWIVWCDTDYEADELAEALPSFVEVRGSMPERKKEEGLASFSNKKSLGIITKPELGGFGLNWQHCCNVVFVGLSYSFERFIQALSRAYRFGQTRIVRVWVIQSETEAVITETVLRKKDSYTEMFEAMALAMRQTQIDNLLKARTLTKYAPGKPMEIPKWMRSTKRTEKTGRSTMATVLNA